MPSAVRETVKKQLRLKWSVVLPRINNQRPAPPFLGIFTPWYDDVSTRPHIFVIPKAAAMAKAQPPHSHSGGATPGEVFDDVEGETNEYGDEAFESEDLSPIRRTSGDGVRRHVGKGTENLDKDAALPAFDNNSDPEMELEVRRCKSNRAHTAHATGDDLLMQMLLHRYTAVAKRCCCHNCESGGLRSCRHAHLRMAPLRTCDNEQSGVQQHSPQRTVLLYLKSSSSTTLRCGYIVAEQVYFGPTR